MADDFSQFADAPEQEDFSQFADAPENAPKQEAMSPSAFLGETLSNQPSRIAGVGMGLVKQALIETPQWVMEKLGADAYAKQFADVGERLEAKVKDNAALKSTMPMGEAIGEGVAFGAGTSVVGGASKLTGLTNKMAGATGYVSPLTKTVAKWLDQAWTNPSSIMLAEGAIAGVSKGAGMTTESVTGSPTAGLVAEILTGIGVSPKVYNEVSDVWHLSKEDYVDRVIANNLKARYTPDELKVAMSSLDNQIKEGFMARKGAVRLDVALQDKTLEKMTSDLYRNNPETQVFMKQWDEGAALHINNLVDSITKNPAASPQEIQATLQTMQNGFMQQYDDSLKVLEGAVGQDTTGVVSQAMYKKFAETFDLAKIAVDKAYGKVDMSATLGPDAVVLLQSAIKSASEVKAAAGADLLGAPVKKAISLLAAETKSGMTIGGLKEVRSEINSLAMAAKVAGDKPTARRLTILADSVTKSFDSFKGNKDFLDANELYKSVRGLEDNMSIYKFFKTNKVGDTRSPVSSFADEFLFGSYSLDDAPKILAFAKSPEGAKFGLSEGAVKGLAEQGLYAKLHVATLDGMNPAKVKQFVAENKDLINAYGLSDKFSNLAVVAKNAVDFKGSAEDVGKLVLAQYGKSANPELLKSMMKGDLWKELGSIPPQSIPSVRAAIVGSMMRKSDGTIRDAKDIIEDLSKYGSKMGISPSYRSDLAALSVMAKAPKGKEADAIKELDRYFNHREFGQEVKSALLERLTRTTLKVLRLGDVVGTTITDKNALQRMREAMFTEDGAKRVLKLAQYDPDSRLFIRWVLAPQRIDTAVDTKESQ